MCGRFSMFPESVRLRAFRCDRVIVGGECFRVNESYEYIDVEGDLCLRSA